jgi:hypothetical protein
MLASKFPMKNKQLLNFTDPWIFSKAALYAEIEGVQIGCTQLSPDIPRLSRLPYLGVHTDSAGQHRHELNDLLNFMIDQDNG